MSGKLDFKGIVCTCMHVFFLDHVFISDNLPGVSLPNAQLCLTKRPLTLLAGRHSWLNLAHPPRLVLATLYRLCPETARKFTH